MGQGATAPIARRVVSGVSAWGVESYSRHIPSQHGVRDIRARGARRCLRALRRAPGSPVDAALVKLAPILPMRSSRSVA